MQLVQEMLDFVGVRFAAAHVADHFAKLVQSAEQRVHRRMRDLALALAQNVQNVFGVVSQFHDVREAEEARSAFHGVKGAKDAVQKFFVFRGGFQRDQVAVKVLQQLIAFGEVILEQRSVLFEFLGHSILFANLRHRRGSVRRVAAARVPPRAQLGASRV